MTSTPDREPDELVRRRELYQRVANLLHSEYGVPKRREYSEPVDVLVNTILSQNTSDVNRDRAFKRLKERFPTWEAVRDAPVEDVVEAIRPAGLSRQKGPRIQAVLRRITEEHGRITLDHLRDMPLDEARAWLIGLNGVGPKTAAIVLLFAMGRPAFPVDTHVLRVSKRLGLVGQKANAERAHRELERIVAPDDYYAFHINMIRHGREVCKARNPDCDRCVLHDYCAFYRSKSGLGSADGVDDER